MTENRYKFALITVVCTVLALIAFAANSVLCRMALGKGAIDASGFTAVRLLAGACVLFLIIAVSKKGSASPKGSWFSGAMLFLYAIAFSFAYNTLDTGSGALILFGSVQMTMILLSVIRGHRPRLSEWAGLVIAFCGFVYLILPGVGTPSPLGFFLMTAAGIAWGIYTLNGRDSRKPLMDTSFNFLRTVPLVLVLLCLAFTHLQCSTEGILLAILSGGIASGVGYTIWYIALGGLSGTQAAVVQLSVPVIAALGGIVFLSEQLTGRLVISAALILSGILMVVLGKSCFVPQKIQR